MRADDYSPSCKSRATRPFWMGGNFPLGSRQAELFPRSGWTGGAHHLHFTARSIAEDQNPHSNVAQNATLEWGTTQPGLRSTLLQAEGVYVAVVVSDINHAICDYGRVCAEIGRAS